IVCAINYNTAQPYSTAFNHPGHGWISRYAWSMEDYHEAVMRRLREVESRLRQESARLQEELQTRCYVDTGPLVERVYAKYAGLGWVGKNTCIINQQIGSWIFLGSILTSIDFHALNTSAEAPQYSFNIPAPDRCGSCTRCIDACP